MKVRLGPLGAPAAIISAWIAVRVTLLLPVPDRVPVTGPLARPSQAIPATVALIPAPTIVPVHQFVEHPVTIAHKVRSVLLAEQGTVPKLAALEAAAIYNTPDAPPAFRGQSGVVAGSAAPQRHRARLLSGSAWALINGTGGAVGVPSLGGSQTGVRLYLQGEGAPAALTARVSRALGRARDTEVSAGYALRARNVGLLLERRERLDVRSGAFVATAYGGAYDVKLPAGLRFDGFAQGGVAGVRSQRWFADGQARATRRATLSSGLTIGAGGGIWASVQQGARRVEAGPLIEARIRAGAVGLRVAGEYRFRVTGDAYPRSGPALTIGLDL